MNEHPTLWGWAQRAYAAPGAQAIWLELQDAHGQSVCLVLWAAWAASVGRRPDAETLTRGVALARLWQGEIIDPLRGQRRRSKPQPGQQPDAQYTWVKSMELEAEKALLAALEAETAGGASEAADPVAAMADACAAWGDPPPRERLEALAASFPVG